MTLIMDDSRLVSIAQIKEFLKIDHGLKFQSASRLERYKWIEEVLLKFQYFGLRKKEKSLVKKYIGQMTGISDSQLTRLVAKKKRFGRILVSQARGHCFASKYGPSDIALLIETDNNHNRLSGPATQRILKREYQVFQRPEYKTIQSISASHIYNLRQTRQYQSFSLTVKRTCPARNNIGQRRKPEPQGKPGYLRVDSVHQGDLDKEKGIYHLNLVDEVVQWEIVAAVEKISEYYLKPLLEDLIQQFPFAIHNFHSDNGSEFINKVVAKLLNKLLIGQTKSRARHCNDNALVEAKNGAIIRKNMGYRHIPQREAPLPNRFYQEYFNPYLNFHRPCGFATIVEDRKGKQKKVYDTYLTPYERLKSLPEAQQYLKSGLSFENLDLIANQKSDNQFASAMQKAKDELFKNFNQKLQFPTAFVTFFSGSSVD